MTQVFYTHKKNKYLKTQRAAIMQPFFCAKRTTTRRTEAEFTYNSRNYWANIHIFLISNKKYFFCLFKYYSINLCRSRIFVYSKIKNNLSKLKEWCDSVPTPPEFIKQESKLIEVRLPEIFFTLKYGKNLSKKDKTLLIYFAILKTFTKSDRLKFEKYNDIAEQLGVSVAQAHKILHWLQKKGFIEIKIKLNLYHLVLKSWQKIINIVINKEITRQKIKFLRLKAQKKRQITAELLKEWYKIQIDKYKKAQKFCIDTKISDVIVKDKYLQDKEQKINKILRSKSDSKHKGAALSRYFAQLNNEYNNRPARNVIKRYKKTITEQEFKTYQSRLFYASIVQSIAEIERPKDLFYICLTSRNCANVLNLSHTQANNLLNHFNYDMTAIRLNDTDKDAVRTKKAAAHWGIQSNAYQFGNYYYFAGRIF